MRPSTPINSMVRTWALCVALLSTLVLTLSVPDLIPSPTIAAAADRDLRSRAEDPFLLRIMPLGASITNGYRSTEHNGYRDYIRQQLRYKGWDVEMVGSLRNGTMIDNVGDHQLQRNLEWNLTVIFHCSLMRVTWALELISYQRRLRKPPLNSLI